MGRDLPCNRRRKFKKKKTLPKGQINEKERGILLAPPNYYAASNTVRNRNFSNWEPIRTYGWISWHLKPESPFNAFQRRVFSSAPEVPGFQENPSTSSSL